MKNLEKIFKYIEDHGITEAAFERKAQMSNGYLTNTRKRGADVSQKILDKVRENLKDEYSKIFSDAPLSEVAKKNGIHDPTPMDAIHSLAESTNKLSDSNLINARNIERLIALLEMRLVTAANINPELAPRGTQGTIPITKEGQQKNQHKAG